MSPKLFRWVLEDVLEELVLEWEAKGRGNEINGQRVDLLCRADDTWVFPASADALEDMLGAICRLTAKRAGLELRPAKCTWARVQRHDGQHAGLGATLAHHIRSTM